MEFDFEIPPHPTVVKGVAMSPEPTIRFKLPEKEDYRALQKMFQVTCTLADVHHVEKGIKPNDVGFAKFQEQISGATATVQYDAANSYLAVFSNLKINVSGYQVFENGRFKKKSKSHFATRYLIFIINFALPHTAPVVIFQQNFAVDVYPSFCNIGTIFIFSVIIVLTLRAERDCVALHCTVIWPGGRGEQNLRDWVGLWGTGLCVLWRGDGHCGEPGPDDDELPHAQGVHEGYALAANPHSHSQARRP